MGLNEELRRTDESLEVALKWVGLNFDRFSLEFWRRDADRRAFPYGPLVELLQVFGSLPKQALTKSVDMNFFISFSRREFADLEPEESRTAFAHVGRLKLDYLARSYGIPDRTKDVQEVDPNIEMSGAFLDDLYIAEMIGRPIRGGDYDAALMRSGLGPGATGRTITRADAYFLTHLVFYATMFGGRKSVLSVKSIECLKRTLSAIASAAQRKSNFDLLAECEASLALLEPDRPSNLMRDRLEEEVSNLGFLPANAFVANSINRLSQDEIFRRSYHATLAFILMISAIGRP